MNYYVRHASFPHFQLKISKSSFALLSEHTKAEFFKVCVWNYTDQCWDFIGSLDVGEKLVADLCLEDRTPRKQRQEQEREKAG